MNYTKMTLVYKIIGGNMSGQSGGGAMRENGMPKTQVKDFRKKGAYRDKLLSQVAEYMDRLVELGIKRSDIQACPSSTRSEGRQRGHANTEHFCAVFYPHPTEIE